MLGRSRGVCGTGRGHGGVVGIAFRLALLQVLISVDLDGQGLLLEVVEEELRHAVNVVVPFVVDLRVLLAPFVHFRGVFCVVHVELVLTENVRAEVLRQLCYAVDFFLEVESLVEEVLWLDVIVEIIQ